MKNLKSNNKKLIKKRITSTIEALELQFAQLKTDLAALSDSEEETTNQNQNRIEIGDLVTSIQAPYYSGKVVRFSANKYWVFIDTGLEHPKRKAQHNVRKR